MVERNPADQDSGVAPMGMSRRRLLTAGTVLASAAVVGTAPPAVAGISQFWETFERPDRDWFFAGGAGFDHGKGLAHEGVGNAWVRQSTGWNAINRFHDVVPRTEYTISAWLRLSESLTDGYFSVREARELNGTGRIIKEVKLVGPGPDNPANAGYNRYTFRFSTGTNSRVLIYIGLWGVGKDAWIQIDDFVLQHNTS